MRQVNLAEAKSHLSALVQAAMTGTDVVIARDGKPMVRLVPVAANAERTLGLAGRKGFFMADDFDAPLDEFADYMK
jgi:prevent-host-death family protein